MKILLVEDVDVLRESLTQWLKSLGWQVTAAKNVADAQQALALKPRQPFKVAIVDLNLDGQEHEQTEKIDRSGLDLVKFL